MAGCFGSCWGSFTDEVRKLRRPVYVRGRAFKRARYNEKQVTIEFENLIDEAYYEAKREASKAARQAKSQGGMSNGAKTAPFSSVLDDVSLSSWKSDVSVTRRVLTEDEQKLISERKYNQLAEQQKRIDAEIDARLKKQEDDLRIEEERLALFLAVSLSSGVATLPTESWESALEATRIAGKSLDSFTHPSTEDGSKDTDR
ncbi:predicted protein [Nematostella vectensis]|uniref:Uncharacterized protein n=1 Tax=Nematostella vectensis TaxID=45351 RepID=A7STS9_NEMVE|nr:predicted protein [Nematostella vectensis]|eukprot:XP_001624988.1 predicted protein [Nematostella vectensis]